MNKAEQVARETATLNGFDADNVRHVVDTSFPQPFPCWILMERPTCAVVVYDDDPNSIVSTGNRPGRYLSIESMG